VHHILRQVVRDRIDCKQGLYAFRHSLHFVEATQCCLLAKFLYLVFVSVTLLGLEFPQYLHTLAFNPFMKCTQPHILWEGGFILITIVLSEVWYSN